MYTAQNVSNDSILIVSCLQPGLSFIVTNNSNRSNCSSSNIISNNSSNKGCLVRTSTTPFKSCSHWTRSSRQCTNSRLWSTIRESTTPSLQW